MPFLKWGSKPAVPKWTVAVEAARLAVEQARWSVRVASELSIDEKRERAAALQEAERWVTQAGKPHAGPRPPIDLGGAAGGDDAGDAHPQ